jgi:hypothetical protein
VWDGNRLRWVLGVVWACRGGTSWQGALAEQACVQILKALRALGEDEYGPLDEEAEPDGGPPAG